MVGHYLDDWPGPLLSPISHAYSILLFSVCSGHRMDTLCSNFRLLRILEQTINNGVSEIDALLGTSIVCIIVYSVLIGTIYRLSPRIAWSYSIGGWHI